MRHAGGAEAAVPFEWIGHALCLDFVNTVSWGTEGPAEERLTAYADLHRWAAEAGLDVPGAGPPARSSASDRAGALTGALELRAVLHAVLLAVAERRARSPRTGDLAAFVHESARHLTLTPGSPVWTFAFGPSDDPASLWWPIAWDAARLLTSDEISRVRRCANDRCRWLFLDTSRRSNRRWCDMAVCGSRAKARRYYHRYKAVSP